MYLPPTIEFIKLVSLLLNGYLMPMVLLSYKNIFFTVSIVRNLCLNFGKSNEDAKSVMDKVKKFCFKTFTNRLA